MSMTKYLLLQALDRDLEDAEEQHGTAVRGHLQLIDSLQDMQYARMKTMQEQFQSNLRVSSYTALNWYIYFRLLCFHDVRFLNK